MSTRHDRQRRGWDEYTPKASHRSDRWACSARGWLNDGDPKAETVLGHYLDYQAGHVRTAEERTAQPGNVHCVIVRTINGAPYPVPHYRYVQTIEEARAWIEEQSGFKPRAMLLPGARPFSNSIHPENDGCTDLGCRPAFTDPNPGAA